MVERDCVVTICRECSQMFNLCMSLSLMVIVARNVAFVHLKLIGGAREESLGATMKAMHVV
jgi:hypothetical protein